MKRLVREEIRAAVERAEIDIAKIEHKRLEIRG